MSVAIATEKKFEEMKDYELEERFTEKMRSFVEEKLMRRPLTLIEVSRAEDVARWREEFERFLGTPLKEFEITTTYHKAWGAPPFTGFGMEFDAGGRRVRCLVGVEATDLSIEARLVDREHSVKASVATSTMDYKPRYNVYCYVKPRQRR